MILPTISYLNHTKSALISMTYDINVTYSRIMAVISMTYDISSLWYHIFWWYLSPYHGTCATGWRGLLAMRQPLHLLRPHHCKSTASSLSLTTQVGNLVVASFRQSSSGLGHSGLPWQSLRPESESGPQGRLRVTCSSLRLTQAHHGSSVQALHERELVHATARELIIETQLHMAPLQIK